jgi:hypothetical protein
MTELADVLRSLAEVRRPGKAARLVDRLAKFDPSARVTMGDAKPPPPDRSRTARNGLRNRDFDRSIRPERVAIRSMTLGVPVTDAAPYLIKKVGAALIR